MTNKIQYKFVSEGYFCVTILHRQTSVVKAIHRPAVSENLGRQGGIVSRLGQASRIVDQQFLCRRRIPTGEQQEMDVVFGHFRNADAHA